MVAKMLGDSGAYEMSADRFLPYLQHIRDRVVALDDSSVMATLAIPGIAFELDPVATRNARPEMLNSLMQIISDDNVTIHTNLIHYDLPPELIQHGNFLSNFAAEAYRNYERVTFGDVVKANVWVMSIIVHPRIHFEGAFKRLYREHINPQLEISEESLRQLEDIMEISMIWLARYGARRLGRRRGVGDQSWITYTEMGQSLALILDPRPHVPPTGGIQPIAAQFGLMPMTNAVLGGQVYSNPVVFGGWRRRHTFFIDAPEGRLYGMIFGYKGYPSKTTVGMLNELLGVEYPIVMTHSGRFLNRSSAQTKMMLKEVQMKNAEDSANSLLDGLAKLRDQIASNEAVTMSHHFSLAVYAHDYEELARVASRALHCCSVGGASITREARGLMGAYFAQPPGGRAKFRCRPGTISSRNYSKLVSLESFPQGEAEGYWGKPIIQFKTNGGTLYNWHPHVGEVGHTFVCGMTGSGKTLFLAFLLCAIQRGMDANDSVVVFDKDQGMQIAIMANGGSYIRLRRGTASGSAPLRVYEDAPRNVGHLAALFMRLIMYDNRGELLPEDEDGMHRGVARQLKLPVHLRSMLGVKAFLGNQPGGAAARFAKWCRGGAYGWLFDNDEDNIMIDGSVRSAGFDFTDLIPTEDRPDDGCAGAMAADIMFRLRQLMDGRRFGFFIDEARFYMDAIAGIIDDLSLTGRKKELALFLAAQKPGHILDHRLGRSILSQCATNFLFPEQGAKWAEYGTQGLGCTPAEFRFLTSLQTVTTNRESQSKRRLIIRRQAGSVVVQFDITGLDDEIAMLSGRTDTANLMQTIADELGDATPDELVAEFKRRWRSLSRISRRAKIIEEELV